MSSIPASAGLLLLRVVIGITALAHGWQKVWLNGLEGTAEGFGGMGIPLPGIAAPLVAYTEIIGGALLVVGLAARFAGLAIGVAMVVALVLVHLPAGFFAADGGIELVLLIAAGAFALALTGSGGFSIDALFSRSRVARRERRYEASPA